MSISRWALAVGLLERQHEGDEAGARAVADEVGRWATAVGAGSVIRQAEAFLAGVDPTKGPDETEE